MLPGTREANERVRKLQQGGIPLLMSQGTGSEVKSLSPEYKLRLSRDGKAAADEWWEAYLKKTGYTEWRPRLPQALQKEKELPEWHIVNQRRDGNQSRNEIRFKDFSPKEEKAEKEKIREYLLQSPEYKQTLKDDGVKDAKEWLERTEGHNFTYRALKELFEDSREQKVQYAKTKSAASKITKATKKYLDKKKSKVRTNVGMEEMIKLRDDAIVAKRARLTGETKAEARKALVAMKAIYVPEPEQPEPERRKDDLDDEFPDLEGLEWTDVPKSQEQAQSGKCPKHPRKHASSVRQTKMAMRGPNPNREGWKLPRKPYGHANEVVELEDDLTDAELKKMTSELPRRCLVEAVADWAKEHNKIVLPSITRADKAEIVATIKEHRIPVPKMSGGGYYGDDMDNILTGEDDSMWQSRGGQIHNEVHLCPECRMGDDDWDFIENERRTTQPYEIAGMGSAASIPRGDPAPRDDPMGEDTEEEDTDEESEDDFSRDVAFVCAECGQDVMWGSPEYAGRRDTDQGPVCADCAELLGIESEDEASDDDTDSGPDGADTPRRARSPDMDGGSIPTPFFHLRGAASEWDWGGDEDVYYDEDGKETTKEKYDELEPILPEQPQFVGDPSQFKVMPFDPNNPMMFMGSGNKGDYLKAAKAFAKKAGYKDWNKIKYATDGVHKLELNGVKFGRKGYGDFIDYGMKDGNKEAQKHRKAYLARATNIKGSWKDDPMSKNNLAIKVLWGGAKQPALPPNIDLVSKKESPVVEEIIEEPMDDTDIRAYYPNAKIMRYSDLKNYKTITQLLPKDKSYAFLLYQQETNSGHWVLIMRYGSTIEFFCSYGSAIDAPLKWTNPRDRQMLGEAVPYLSNLLKSQKEFNVIHNPVQYQSKGSDKATCGAHDVMRLSQMLNHGQDLTDYYDFMSRVKKESGLSYDEIVANFVSQR